VHAAVVERLLDVEAGSVPVPVPVPGEPAAASTGVIVATTAGPEGASGSGSVFGTACTGAGDGGPTSGTGAGS
jgi:hypothetical protein